MAIAAASTLASVCSALGFLEEAGSDDGAELDADVVETVVESAGAIFSVISSNFLAWDSSSANLQEYIYIYVKLQTLKLSNLKTLKL